MSRPGTHDDTDPTRAADTGRDAFSGPVVGTRSDAEGSVIAGDRPVVACPHCGHDLSMFTESASSRAEAAATRISLVFGSWRFLVLLALVIVSWCAVNVVMRPFDPHPTAMLTYLGIALAAVTALQGPLILFTQHREAARDRRRDVEVLAVCQNTEADVHAIRAVLEDGRGPRSHTPGESPRTTAGHTGEGH